MVTVCFAHVSVDGGGGSEYTPTPREEPPGEDRPNDSPPVVRYSQRDTIDAATQDSTELSSVAVVITADSNSHDMAAKTAVSPSGSSTSKLDHVTSGVEIMIGLEDEAGTAAAVEIDEADEVIIKEEEPGEQPRGQDRGQGERPRGKERGQGERPRGQDIGSR